MANNVDTDQTDPLGAVCSGSMLFASLFNLSVMLGNYLQQTTSADSIFIGVFCLQNSLFITHLVYNTDLDLTQSCCDSQIFFTMEFYKKAIYKLP